MLIEKNCSCEDKAERLYVNWSRKCKGNGANRREDQKALTRTLLFLFFILLTTNIYDFYRDIQSLVKFDKFEK